MCVRVRVRTCVCGGGGWRDGLTQSGGAGGRRQLQYLGWRVERAIARTRLHTNSDKAQASPRTNKYTNAVEEKMEGSEAAVSSAEKKTEGVGKWSGEVSRPPFGRQSAEAARLNGEVVNEERNETGGREKGQKRGRERPRTDDGKKTGSAQAQHTSKAKEKGQNKASTVDDGRDEGTYGLCSEGADSALAQTPTHTYTHGRTHATAPRARHKNKKRVG